jgi:hypothetical protein
VLDAFGVDDVTGHDEGHPPIGVAPLAGAVVVLERQAERIEVLVAARAGGAGPVLRELVTLRLAEIERLEHRDDVGARGHDVPAKDLLEDELPAAHRIGAVVLGHRREQRRLGQDPGALGGIEVHLIPVVRRRRRPVEVSEGLVPVSVRGGEKVRQRPLLLEQDVVQEAVRLLPHVVGEQRREVRVDDGALGQRGDRVDAEPLLLKADQVLLGDGEREQPLGLAHDLVGLRQRPGVGGRAELRVRRRPLEEVRQPGRHLPRGQRNPLRRRVPLIAELRPEQKLRRQQHPLNRQPQARRVVHAAGAPLRKQRPDRLLLRVAERMPEGALAEIVEIRLRAGGLAVDRDVAPRERRRIRGHEPGHRLGGRLILLGPDQAARLRARQVGEAEDVRVVHERQRRQRVTREQVVHRGDVLVVRQAPDRDRLGRRPDRRRRGRAASRDDEPRQHRQRCRSHQPP